MSTPSSDNRIRGWLREHGIAVSMRNNRQELLQRMRENCKACFLLSNAVHGPEYRSGMLLTDVSTQGGLHDIYDSVSSFLKNGVHISEEKAYEALNLLKGAVSGNNPFAGEDLRLKAKYGAHAAGQKAASVSSKAEASATDAIGSLSLSADSIYSQATVSARDLARSAEASASSAADRAVCRHPFISFFHLPLIQNAFHTVLFCR